MSRLTLMPFDPSRPLGPGAPVFPWKQKMRIQSIIKILQTAFHIIICCTCGLGYSNGKLQNRKIKSLHMQIQTPKRKISSISLNVPYTTGSPDVLLVKYC